MPGGPERVGCGPRRSPGRMGGRVWPVGGIPGRCGRWKIGLPRSGITTRGGAPAGRTGAWYTGRGPVCGTINRRGGGTGVALAAGGAGDAGRDGGAATCAAGADGAAGFGGATCAAGGAAAAGSAGAAGAAISGASVSGASRTAVLLSTGDSARACDAGDGGVGGAGFGGIT